MGPQNRSGRGGEKEERCFCTKMNPIPGPSRLFAILTELSQIPQNCKRLILKKKCNFSDVQFGVECKVWRPRET
jgi:hypothetical protein